MHLKNVLFGQKLAQFEENSLFLEDQQTVENKFEHSFPTSDKMTCDFGPGGFHAPPGVAFATVAGQC